jgi:Protein of unknown function (DUF4199)
MRRIALKYGLIAGSIFGLEMAIMLPLCMRGVVDFSKSEVVGYSAMVLAFLLVFFGVRTYREEVAGGTISFAKALGVGLLITAVACTVYVVAWEIVFWGFIPDFADQYGAFVIDKLRADGASAAVIQAKQAEMAHFAELYTNPLFNILVTFLEPLPVGLLISLVSAAILRRRPEGRRGQGGEPVAEVG